MSKNYQRNFPQRTVAVVHAAIIEFRLVQDVVEFGGSLKMPIQPCPLFSAPQTFAPKLQVSGKTAHLDFRIGNAAVVNQQITWRFNDSSDNETLGAGIEKGPRNAEKIQLDNALIEAALRWPRISQRIPLHASVRHLTLFKNVMDL